MGDALDTPYRDFDLLLLIAATVWTTTPSSA